MNIRRTSGILFFFSLLAWLPFAAQGREKEQVPPPPPLAKTGLANVYIDQARDITLEVSGRIVEPLTFLLRKPPRHGRLSEIRRTGRNTAVVTYTPLEGAVPVDDIFTFAAKSPDSPVSAPASVWVRLMERPPVLEHPEKIDFGTVYLGDESRASAALGNSGGGIAPVRVVVNPPWSVSGSHQLAIPSGSEKNLTVIFRPSEERDFSDRLRLGNDPADSIELRGTGIAPLSWPKAGIVFPPEQRQEGFTEITLTNKTPVERSAGIEWPAEIQAQREITLPPSGSATLRVSVARPLTKLLQGQATVRSGNFTSAIPLTIYPAPARLATEPESRVDLGKVRTGTEAKGKLLVRNTGESDTSLTITATDGLTITPDTRSLILGPGMDQSLDVTLARVRPGKHQGTVSIRIPSNPDPREIEVVAETEERESASVPVENFLHLPQPAPQPRDPAASLPPVTSAWFASSGEHEITINWDVPSAEYSSFRIVRRVLTPASGSAGQAEWRNWPEVAIQLADGKATAQWNNLPADAFWTIRIIGIDRHGNPGPPSPAFKISTRPEKRVSVPSWVWLLLAAGLIACATYLYRLRQKVLLDREDARIQALELERKS